MTDLINDFSRPATKVADCMAVVSRSPGVNPEFEPPRVEIFGCCRAGLFVRFLSLAQYARARTTLAHCDIFDVRVFGSLV